MMQKLLAQKDKLSEAMVDTPEPPEGWVLSLMGDVAEVVGGGTPKSSDPDNFSNEGYPWLTPADLSGFKGIYISRGKRSLSEKGLHGSSARLLPTGAVLMSSRAPIGYLAVAANEVSTNQGFKSFICHESLLPEYVFYWLMFLKPSLEQLGSGSTFAEISGSRARQIPILIAPLAEQKRIVGKIEELFSRINATRERLVKVPAILRRFRQAVLASACSGRLTEDWRQSHPNTNSAAEAIRTVALALVPKKFRKGVPISVNMPEELGKIELPSTWTLKSVSDLLRSGGLIDVKDGNHGSNHPKHSEFAENGLPFITASQVKDYWIDYDGAPKVAEPALRKLRVGFAELGDVVLTHKGTVGRAAVNLKPCVLTPQTTYYRCNTALIKPQFLVFFFKSPQFFSQLAAVMSQTTRDFVPISEQYCLFVFVPPASEQEEIARRVTALFGLAETVRKRWNTVTRSLEKLSEAVLLKTFRGELVPTEAELARREGRSYESASELLARIKSSGNSSKSKPVRQAQDQAYDTR